MQKRNSVIVLFSLVFGFFVVGFVSVGKFFGQLFGKNTKPIRENTFLDSLNFLVHSGPKSFWKKPTGLKMGRSISTFLHYLFAKNENYSEKIEGEKTSSKKRAPHGRGGFTLVETIISVTLFAMILVVAFGALSGIGSGRVRVNNELDLNKDIYYAFEKFSTLVKEGGTIDYEEYWNRSSLNDTATSSGHFTNFSGYGNYSTGATSGNLYKCEPMIISGSGCLQVGRQTYGEYALQFIDYGTLSTQDDDENLGKGPIVFTGGQEVTELYLIKKGGILKERLFFRYNLTQDLGDSSACDITTKLHCVGNLQMLRLTGADMGLDHSGSLGTKVGWNDGIIDTWNCDKDFCNGLPIGADSEWADVFPSYLNVKDVKFFVSPNKDGKLAWKETTGIVSPYVRVVMKIGFANERRKQLKGIDPTISVATTFNLE